MLPLERLVPLGNAIVLVNDSKDFACRCAHEFPVERRKRSGPLRTHAREQFGFGWFPPGMPTRLPMMRTGDFPIHGRA